MKNLSVINLLILLVVLLIFSSCASYQYSNKRKGERTHLNIHEKQDMFDLRRLEAQQIPGPKSRGIMIGDMISLAAEGVKLLIEADKKKYTGKYRTEFTWMNKKTFRLFMAEDFTTSWLRLQSQEEIIL